MLTTTNRGGIRASVRQWSQRKAIPDDILNDFIEIALSTANRALRIPSLEAYQALPLDANGYALIPTDYIEAKEAYVEINGVNVLLERKAINEVDFVANANGVSGIPCFFGRFGTHFRVAPWSGETSTLNLYYYNIIPAMPDDDSTNWFTLYAPEVLLYGALAELCNYTRDNEGIQIWSQKFTTAINTIQAVEDRAMWNGSTIGISLKGSTR